MSTQSSADAGQLLLDAAGIVVLCGSEKDKAHASGIAEAAREFGLRAVIRIASAHRTPEKALQIVRDANALSHLMQVIMITVAGRSNASLLVENCRSRRSHARKSLLMR